MVVYYKYLKIIRLLNKVGLVALDFDGDEIKFQSKDWDALLKDDQK